MLQFIDYNEGKEKIGENWEDFKNDRIYFRDIVLSLMPSIAVGNCFMFMGTFSNYIGHSINRIKKRDSKQPTNTDIMPIRTGGSISTSDHEIHYDYRWGWLDYGSGDFQVIANFNYEELEGNYLFVNPGSIFSSEIKANNIAIALGLIYGGKSVLSGSGGVVIVGKEYQIYPTISWANTTVNGIGLSVRFIKFKVEFQAQILFAANSDSLRVYLVAFGNGNLKGIFEKSNQLLINYGFIENILESFTGS